MSLLERSPEAPEIQPPAEKLLLDTDTIAIDIADELKDMAQGHSFADEEVVPQQVGVVEQEKGQNNQIGYRYSSAETTKDGIELEGITSEYAITVLRGVEKYGPKVVKGTIFRKRLADENLRDASQAARQIERTAVDSSFTPVDFTEDVAEIRKRVAEKNSKREELSAAEEATVDYYESIHNLKHGLDVSVPQFAFLARCLMRGAKEDTKDSQSYEDVLGWMRENPRTSPVIEALEVDKSDKTEHLSKKVVQFFFHIPRHSRVNVAH